MTTPQDWKDSKTAFAETANYGSWTSVMLDTWVPEIFATTLSTISLLATIAILPRHDEMIPRFLPRGGHLHTGLAVLTTVSRFATIYTVVVCCVQLIWRSNHRPHSLQYSQNSTNFGMTAVYSRTRGSIIVTGAIVVLLGLLLDFATQQSLVYTTDITISAGMAANITRSKAFLPSVTDSDTFARAINTGIWTSTPDTKTEPSYSANSCREIWEYRSVGWCHQCRNVQEHATLSNCSFLGLKDDTASGGLTGYARMYEDNSCITSLGRGPSGRLARYHSNVFGDSQEDFNVWTISSTVTWLLSEANETIGAWAGIDHPIFALGFVKVAWSDDSEDLYIAEAEECAISLCERRVRCAGPAWKPGGNTFVNWGHLTKHESRNIPCWQPREAGSTRGTNLEELEDSHTTTNMFDVDEQPYDASTGSFCPRGLSTGQWMKSLNNSIISKNVQFRISTGMDLAEVAAGIAASLTNLGLKDKRYTEPVIGSSNKRQAAIQVNWSWIGVPCLLNAATILLLMSVKNQRHGRRVRTWKSAVLPLLLHGFSRGATINAVRAGDAGVGRMNQAAPDQPMLR